MHSFLKYPLVISVAVSALMGCGTEDTKVSLSEDSGQEDINLVNGQLFSVNSLSAIEGVEVKLLINGHDYRSATSSEVLGDIHTDGYFSFDDVPLGQHTLIIEHPDYASVTRNISFSENDSQHTLGLGKLGLATPIELDVVVSSEQGSVASAVVQAELISPDYYCTDGTQIQLLGTEDRISATTNSEGIATLEGLSSCGIYQVVVPALDVDGDGIFDYSTTVTDESYYNVSRVFGDSYYNRVEGILPQTVPGPLNIFMDETEYDYNVSIISTNISSSSTSYYLYKDNESISGSLRAYSFEDSSKIEVRYNYPVEMKQDITVEQVDFQASSENSVKFKEFPSTVTLDESETILTITPQSGEFNSDTLFKVGGAVAAKGKEGATLLPVLGGDGTYLVPSAKETEFRFSAELGTIGSYSTSIYSMFSTHVTGRVDYSYTNTYSQPDSEYDYIYGSDSNRINYDTESQSISYRAHDTLYRLDPAFDIEISYELVDVEGNVYVGEYVIPGTGAEL